MTVARDKSAWVLGGELLLADKVPGGDDRNMHFTRMGLGLRYKFPLRWTMLGRQASLHTRVVGYHYFDQAKFKSVRRDIELANTIQIDLPIGIDPAAKFLDVPLRELEHGYRFSPNVVAITLATSFPF